MIVQGGCRAKVSEQRTADRGTPGRAAEENFAVREAVGVWEQRERIALWLWLLEHGAILTGTDR